MACKMGPRCAVAGCVNNLRERKCGISLHCLPNCEELRTLWIASLNFGNSVPNKYTRVCSDHFKDEDFKTRNYRRGCKHVLRPHAVPSRNLGGPEMDDLEEGDIEMPENIGSEDDSDNTDVFCKKCVQYKREVDFQYCKCRNLERQLRKSGEENEMLKKTMSGYEENMRLAVQEIKTLKETVSRLTAVNENLLIQNGEKVLPDAATNKFRLVVPKTEPTEGTCVRRISQDPEEDGGYDTQGNLEFNGNWDFVTASVKEEPGLSSEEPKWMGTLYPYTK